MQIFFIQKYKFLIVENKEYYSIDYNNLLLLLDFVIFDNIFFSW